MNDLTTGFLKKLDENYNPDAEVVYTLHELYGKDITNQELEMNKGIIDYIDSGECDTALIARKKMILIIICVHI